MIKTFAIFILLFTATPSLHAQIENIPDDSIAVYLSKKWQEKARFLNRQQIAIFGDAMVYEFNEDKTFTKKYDNKVTKGSWNYDSKLKVVQLLIENKTNFYIVLLNKIELLLSAELYEGQDKGSGILVLLKPSD